MMSAVRQFQSYAQADWSSRVFLVMCLFLNSFILSAQPHEIEGYRAAKVEGLILSRSPVGTSWRQIKSGQTIWLNHLLQISDRSSLTLQPVKIDSRGTVKVITEANGVNQFRLSTPMVIRISKSMFKQVDFSRNFVEKEFAEAQSRESDGGQGFFADAWQRTADFMGAKPKELSKEELAKMNGDLAISSGLQGSFFSLEKNTAEIAISWLDKSGANGKAYKIYVWKKGEKKGAAVGSSSTTSFNLNLTDPGEYNVQVEAADGKLATKPVKFYVDYEDVTPAGKEAMVSSSENLVKLIYPKSSQVFLDVAPKTWIRFSWRPYSGFDQPLTLTILKNNRIFSQENVTGLLSKSLELPIGQYKWFLSKPSGRFSGSQMEATSEMITFEVRAAKPQDLMSIVRLNLGIEGNTSIVVSEW